MTAIGLDIGGANLKAAHSDGVTRVHAFALWKRPQDLTQELRRLVAFMPHAEHLAVTMTGELCDCFATKRDGVRHILESVAEVAGPKPVHIWRTDGRFASLKESLADPLPAAAANWLALTTFAGRFAPIGTSMLLDIGSTTTDIVPLLNGKPNPRARTDMERLQCRELVYTGVRRTPVCALLDPGDGMAEFFATMHDVHLLLGNVEEDVADCDTADGRTATHEHARARLARMLGGDCESIDSNTTYHFAASVAKAQINVIVRGVRTVASRLAMPPLLIIVAGSGTFLVKQAIPHCFDAPVEIVEFPGDAEAACAVAVSNLLLECLPRRGVPVQ